MGPTVVRGSLRGPLHPVVVASTRTGSSWLTSLLDSHPDIRCHGELFNLESAPAVALSDPARYLDGCLAADGNRQVVGYKILYHQARLDYLNEFLDEMDQGRRSTVDWRAQFPIRPVTADQAPALAAAWDTIRDRPGTRIIHLRRRNLLRQHLSHQILMADSRARWRARDVSVPSAPVILMPAQMVERFMHTLRGAEVVDGFFASTSKLDVWYEDLVADAAGQCDRILRFLDLPFVPLRSAKPPPTHRDLRAAIGNYDDIAAALAGTQWKAFLDGE